MDRDGSDGKNPYRSYSKYVLSFYSWIDEGDSTTFVDFKYI